MLLLETNEAEKIPLGEDLYLDVARRINADLQDILVPRGFSRGGGNEDKPLPVLNSEDFENFVNLLRYCAKNKSSKTGDLNLYKSDATNEEIERFKTSHPFCMDAILCEVYSNENFFFFCFHSRGMAGYHSIRISFAGIDAVVEKLLNSLEEIRAKNALASKNDSTDASAVSRA
jgi:hypothetical protein